MPDDFEYQDEWLDALSVLKPLITQQDLRDLYHSTTLEYASGRGVNMAYFVLRDMNNSRARTLTACVHPALRTFDRIERLEVLLWVACVAHVYLRSGSSWHPHSPYDSHRVLCRHAGCACSAALVPSERWRQLRAHTTPAAELYALAEHPHYCVVCDRPTFSDEPERELHEGCRTYVHTVIKPMHREALRREAMQNVADQDR